MRIHQLRFVPILLVVLCALASSSAFAQQETATIAGTVRDASGAVVPGATITVTNIRTNIAVRTVAGDDGGYVIPSLRPGDYSVTAESVGFQKDASDRHHVAGRPGRARRHGAPAGQITEAVEVVGGTPLLDRRVVSRVGDRSEEDRRSSAERPRLQPARAAVARCAARDAAARQRELQGRPERQRQPHVQQRVPARRGGQHLVLELVPRRKRAAGAAVDRGAAGVQDPDERLLRGIGRSSGAVVNATIKSGTNAIRGSVYEFLRNDRLDANNFFSNALGAPKPKRERNQFGAAAGGRSSGTGRSGLRTMKGCAISRACLASGRCRPPRKRPGCSAARSWIRSPPGRPNSPATRRANG